MSGNEYRILNNKTKEDFHGQLVSLLSRAIYWCNRYRALGNDVGVYDKSGNRVY